MLHNLAQLPRYRGLIQSLVARELKARYRGSVLGFFWSFINPLLLLLVYTFMFTFVMPARRRASIRTRCSCSAVCCRGRGLPRRSTESAGVLISGGNLIKKVLFPAEILPIVTVTANMMHFFLALPILVVLPDLVQGAAARRRTRSVPARHGSPVPVYAGLRADPVGADGALPRHPRHSRRTC